MSALLAPPPVPGIPSPRELPLVGSLVPFARDPIGFLRKVHADHGDLVQFCIANHRIVLVAHPDLIEELLVQRARSLHKDALYDELKPLLGEGLVTAEGDTWKRHRRLAAPSFTPKQIERYAATMARCASDWVAGVVDGAEVDLHHEMMQLTQAIVLETLFGDLELDLRAAGPAIGVVMDEFVVDAQGHRRLWPAFLPSVGRRRARAAIAELDALIHRIIAIRRERPAGDDLLWQLLQARDDDGGGMSDQQLRDEVITMFAAGHETTAVALTYALLLLSRHPEEQEALAAHPERAEAVLQESMRLLPPVWAIGRQTMEPIELGGRSIPVGIQLIVAQAVTHVDARFFPDPERFSPDRWAAPVHPRYAFVPFGGGPRVCIGNHFAMREGILALQAIVGALEVEATGPFPPPLQPSITLRPRGPVPARLHRRASA